MKLDDFILHPHFSNYAKQVDAIHDEFIDEQCEKYLWTKFDEDKKAMEFTCELAKKYGHVATHEKIKEFIEQFSFLSEDDIAFIYPEDYTPKFLIAQEISKQAKTIRVLSNVFDEDDTKNWLAVFDKNDIENIDMMFHVVYALKGQTGDNFGGYKLFGRSLMYYSECLEYEGQRLEPEWPKMIVHFQGNNFRRDTNPFMILESRKVVKMLLRLNYFSNEYELFYNLFKVLLPFMQNLYEKAYVVVRNAGLSTKIKVKEIESSLVADGKIVSKWKSEHTLFTLIRKEYPDALFQYRPEWLEPQNLDIYIPSINVGIEYQGIQHYEAIDFFGGEDALIHRQELDKRKKQLCSANKVKLIAWPYTCEITKGNLKKLIGQ